MPAASAGLPDGAYRIGIRPHHLSLEERPGRVRLAGRVVICEVTGSETFVHADAGGARVVALVPGVRRVEPGDAVALHFDPAAMLIFEAGGRAVATPAARAA